MSVRLKSSTPDDLPCTPVDLLGLAGIDRRRVNAQIDGVFAQWSADVRHDADAARLRTLFGPTT